MRPAAALLAALALALAGCASALRAEPPPSADLRPGVVFVVHGIWPDGSWCTDAESAFRKAGLAVVPVEYTTFIAGFVFGFGTDAAAERLVETARAIERRHAESGCRAPLRFHSIAYSAGTVVTLKAAWRGVRFESAHFGGTPIPFLSPVLADAVRAREIGRVVNYWSLFDSVVGWGFGAGQFGYHGHDEAGCGLAIKNVPLAYHHLWPPFDEALCGAIAREIQADARTAATAHTCGRPVEPEGPRMQPAVASGPGSSSRGPQMQPAVASEAASTRDGAR